MFCFLPTRTCKNPSLRNYFIIKLRSGEAKRGIFQENSTTSSCSSEHLFFFIPSFSPKYQNVYYQILFGDQWKSQTSLGLDNFCWVSKNSELHGLVAFENVTSQKVLVSKDQKFESWESLRLYNFNWIVREFTKF